MPINIALQVAVDNIIMEVAFAFIIKATAA